MRRRALVLLAPGLLLVAAVVLVRPQPAAACSCAMQSVQQQLDNADAVFAGQLTEIVPPKDRGSSGADQTLRFIVDRVYKGEVGQAVEVHTAEMSSSCGLGFSELGPYVIFASGRGVTFSSNGCSGSTAGGAPASLGEGRAPSEVAAGSSPTSSPTPEAVVPPTPGAAPVGWWLLAAGAAVGALLLVRWRRARQR